MENFQKLPFGTLVQACATPTPHTSATQGDNQYKGAKRQFLKVLHLASPIVKQFDDVHHQIWVSRGDCDQKNGMFLHRNEN